MIDPCLIMAIIASVIGVSVSITQAAGIIAKAIREKK